MSDSAHRWSTHPPATAVVGAGSWGTALASLLAECLPRVTLWCHEADVAEGINRTHRNPVFVSEYPLPPNLAAATDLDATVRDHDLLVMVVPTQFTRGVLERMRPALGAETVLVSASKGIEVNTLMLLSEIYPQVLGAGIGERLCYLSGPSFAREVLAKQPTAVALAGSNAPLVLALQELLRTPWFRAYSTDDVTGVELGGALKNVVALAAGISDGLGFGHNARAALITRGLAEIGRLCAAMGGRAETLAGLSGLGDLLLTATSEQSRNRTVGYRLGRGEPMAHIRAGSREVPEGVQTTLSAHQLAQRLGVEMPITEAVYRIIHQGADPHEVVSGLMSRELRPEVG